jgi:UDP-N-acetylmuramoyl-tripeptide--D-alanyl-D-alanine ligase
MKPLTLSQVAELAGGRLLNGGGALTVSRVCTDTRALSAGDLFVALRGKNFDGHDFIGQAAERGAAAALVDQTPAAAGNFPLILVDDTLAGLQRLAKNYRRTLTVKVVAITGSNGKTSAKEFVAAVLSAKFKTHKTEGNLNNHIGVPLTVLGIDDSHEYAVIELGMNHPGELAPLVEMARPDIGIITSIGWAHIGAFADREAIAREKARVIECLPADGLAVLIDDEWLPLLTSLTKARVARVSGTMMRGVVTGSHMARNASLAAAVGAELGIGVKDVMESLAAVRLPENRSSARKFRDGWLLDDTYNASPDSMFAAFHALAELPGEGRKVALLGSMGELGAHAARLHREVGAAAAREGIALLFTLGANAQDLVAGAADSDENQQVASGDYHAFSDHAALLAAYWEQARADDKILVKGSRSQRMELIVSELGRREAACCIS